MWGTSSGILFLFFSDLFFENSVFIIFCHWRLLVSAYGITSTAYCELPVSSNELQYLAVHY